MYDFYFVEFAPGSKGTFVAYLLQLLLGQKLVLLDNKTSHLHKKNLNAYPEYLFNLHNPTTKDLDNCKQLFVFGTHDSSLVNKNKVKIFKNISCKHIKIVWEDKDLEDIFANRWKKVYIDCYTDNQYVNGKLYWEDMLGVVYKNFLNKKVKKNLYPKPLDLTRKEACKIFALYLENCFPSEHVVKRYYFKNNIQRKNTLILKYNELNNVYFLQKILDFLKPIVPSTNDLNNALQFALNYTSKQNTAYINLMQLFK